MRALLRGDRNVRLIYSSEGAVLWSWNPRRDEVSGKKLSKSNCFRALTPFLGCISLCVFFFYTLRKEFVVVIPIRLDFGDNHIDFEKNITRFSERNEFAVPYSSISHSARPGDE